MPNIRRQNKIIADNGTWVEVDISSPRHPSASMKIDKTSWEYVLSFGYGGVYVHSCGGGEYLYASCTQCISGGGRVKHRIHRMLLPFADEVDHINGDGLDNRLANIRGCTRSQNQMNRKLQKNNTSGRKGVVFVGGIWVAQIQTDGKNKTIGRYKNKEDAVAARAESAAALQGEFANE